MIIDQAEIDALRKGPEAETPAPAVAPGPGAAPNPTVKLELGRRNTHADSRVARILRIRVPAIVLLARRKLTVQEARRLSLGAILEFEKAITDPLELLINREVIASGEAVKVGDNFGIRIQQVDDVRSRVRSLGERQP